MWKEPLAEKHHEETAEKDKGVIQQYHYCRKSSGFTYINTVIPLTVYRSIMSVCYSVTQMYLQSNCIFIQCRYGNEKSKAPQTKQHEYI